jgi:hypothetical protein
MMEESERMALAPYVALIEDFLAGRTSAEEFEARYESRYLAEPHPWDAQTFPVLDRLFADVDFFVADDELREPGKGDLDAVGLAHAARRALAALEALT